MSKVEMFRPQVEQQIARAQVLADELSLGGRLDQAEIVLGLRQTIRILWHQLEPPAPPAETPPTEPPQAS